MANDVLEKGIGTNENDVFVVTKEYLTHQDLKTVIPISGNKSQIASDLLDLIQKYSQDEKSADSKIQMTNPIIDSDSDTILYSGSVLDSDSDSGSDSDLDSDSILNYDSDSGSDSDLDSDSILNYDSDSGSDSDLDSDSILNYDSDSGSDSNPDSDSVLDSDSILNYDSDSGSGSGPDSDSVLDSDSILNYDSDSGSGSGPDSGPDSVSSFKTSDTNQNIRRKPVQMRGRIFKRK